MQNEKTKNKYRLVSRLASWVTLGAAAWLWFVYYVFLDVNGALIFWIAAIAAAVASVLSIAKVVISHTWRARLLGVVFVLINLTVIAMSTFSIVLSHVNFLG